MISVKVSYTVNPAFVAQNKHNIQLFLTDFKQLTSLNFMYNVYLQEDGLTFLHISMYENEEVQQAILKVPSFINFQKERDESSPSQTPEMATLSLIGSSLRLL